MIREMRRSKQVMPDEEVDRILNSHTAGVLAVAGDDDYPYAVPLSYIYKDGRIYFHCAREGHKLDGIRRNDKVSFCVIDKDDIKPEEITTYFQSVIVFGRARIVTDDGVKRAALEALAGKYSPGFEEKSSEAIKRDLEKTCVVEIEIGHKSGKRAIELVS
jgi:nitroimidazol reductase NimA-like FMN-containing flavoprotein (pyridoxamine 5'-phosphate oxidase superfamily)